MAKQTTTTTANVKPIAEIEKEFRALFGQADKAGTAAATQGSVMCQIALKGAQAIVDGLYVGKPTEVGKHIYGLSGRTAVTDTSFGSQSSKLAKCFKLAMAWEKRGIGTLELCMNITERSYNGTLELIGIVNRQTEKATSPPSADDVKAWWKDKPKVETSTTNADRLKKVMALLGEMHAAAPHARIASATRELVAYAADAGSTSAAVKAKEADEKRAAEYAAQLAAMIAAKPKGDGANA